VVSGAFHVGMGDKSDTKNGETLLSAVSSAPKKTCSTIRLTTAPTVIRIQSPFTINYVNPADDPRNKTSEKK
jgi:hypothetical protein